MRQLNDNIITVQAAATVTSPIIPAVQLFSCSVQIAATGAAGGTLVLQASNDESTSLIDFPPTNWSAIPSASVTVTGAGAFLIPKTDLCYQFVRVVYTNSGSGTISVVFKALGA
jgi:hypothetical protein